MSRYQECTRCRSSYAESPRRSRFLTEIQALCLSSPFLYLWLGSIVDERPMFSALNSKSRNFRVAIRAWRGVVVQLSTTDAAVELRRSDWESESCIGKN